MDSIEELVSKIRDFINKPRKQHLLIGNKGFWNQLCSSMDVIQDTDVAMDSYLENPFPKDIGEQYLKIYGILQILYVQQDATENLVESLSLPKPTKSELNKIKDIRHIRNVSTGHPTKKGKKEGKISYHFISRITMSKNGFQLMSYSPKHKEKFTDINIPNLISKQRTVITKILGNVIAELKREETMHKDKFKDEKLDDIFQSNLVYTFSKIWEAIHSHKVPNPLGLSHLKAIEKILETYKEALGKRDLWGVYENINYLYDELSYPIDELEKYFQRESITSEAKKRANIYMFFIEKKVEKLKESAKEIDENYSQTENEHDKS